MTEPTALISIKGLRDGLLVTMGNAPWEELRGALMEQIEARQSFFQGARVALDVGAQIFRVNDLSELRDTLSERGINLWAVVSESPTTEQTAQLLGLATRISKPRPQEVTRALSDEADEHTSLFIGRTLRSGTRIEFAGHVTVLGDINPGAEVIAGGNVIVWGRVRGAVHAGVNGDPSSAVCGLDLSLAQIRIAGESVEAPEQAELRSPQKISVVEGRPRFEAWQAE